MQLRLEKLCQFLFYFENEVLNQILRFAFINVYFGSIIVIFEKFFSDSKTRQLFYKFFHFDVTMTLFKFSISHRAWH